MHFARIAPIALLAVVAGGCFSPYLKHAANTPDPKPANVLVAGFVVHFESAGEKSALGAIVDAAQNAGLDDFGKKATPMLAETLAAHGYTATYDAQRAKKLDAVEIASNSGTAALTGQWRHPDASYWTPLMVDSLFVKPADIVGKIKTDQKEFFAFTDVSIADGGMFFKEPIVIVRTAIYDQDAKKVLDLGGIGEGDSSFFVANRSPANLEAALKKAFGSVSTAAEQTL
jgi:hypothetical protein